MMNLELAGERKLLFNALCLDKERKKKTWDKTCLVPLGFSHGLDLACAYSWECDLTYILLFQTRIQQGHQAVHVIPQFSLKSFLFVDFPQMFSVCSSNIPTIYF